MQYTLDEILKYYAKPGDVFSFICPTENLCVQLLNELSLRYRDSHFVICREKSIIFENLSVAENLFIDKAYALPRLRKKQIDRCRALLDRFGIALDPYMSVGDLKEEERQLLELLRIILKKPGILFLYRVTSVIGYYYFNIFCDLLNYLKAQGCMILLLTSRWEDAVHICKNVAVMPGENELLSVLSVEEIEKNPERLMMALSAYDVEGREKTLNIGLQSALNAIFAGSRLLDQSRSLKETFSVFTASVKKEMDASSCIIYLHDYDGKILGFYDQQKMGREFRIKDSYAARLIEKTESTFIVTKNRYKLSDFFEHIPDDVQMIVFSPVYVMPEKIGLLQLTFSYAFLPDEAYITSVKSISNEVSRIIQASRLINNTTLLQESNHRIKNNLQMIVGFLQMQKNFLRKREKEVFSAQDFGIMCDQIINRVKTVAEIHSYLSEHMDTGMRLPMQDIVQSIAKFYSGSNVDVKISSDETNLQSDKALLMAMMINEIISNSMKHAFSSVQGQSRIDIQCVTEKGRYRVEIHDNGCGLPESFDFEGENGVGMMLIRGITSQMGGTVSFRSENGTTVRLSIPCNTQLQTDEDFSGMMK